MPFMASIAPPKTHESHHFTEKMFGETDNDPPLDDEEDFQEEVVMNFDYVRDHHWIIHPYSTFRFNWDICCMLAIIIVMIALPLQVAFDESDQIHLSPFFPLNLVLDMFFFIDLIINFRTGYMDKDNPTVILDSKLIVRHYLKTWFAVDFISLLPLDYMLTAVLIGGQYSTIRASKVVIKLLRWPKVTKTQCKNFMIAFA